MFPICLFLPCMLDIASPQFNNDTRETLCSKVKSGLTMLCLICKMKMDSDILVNTNIEKNNEDFTAFAFDTYVKAYERAGILNLDVMNKIKIMLTDDSDESLSKIGIKQTLTVATDQVGAYSKNPSFAIKQAAELYSHQNEIKLMIVNMQLSIWNQ